MKTKSVPQGEFITGRYTRRRFLGNAALAAAGLTLGSASGTLLAAPKHKKLPPPDQSGVEHIVVVTMENRSFDHFLGWLPGADGRQAGLRYPDASNISHSTFPLAPDFQGCDHPDLDHTYDGGRVEYNNGACDGWLRAGANDLFAIGYYTQADLPFLGSAARLWTTCDRYFSAIMAPTYPNRIYLHAAQTDRLDDSILPLSTLPTIWDRLAARGLSSRYYFSDFPFLALWGSTYSSIAHTLDEFLADCATGNLPSVSYVDPLFLGENEGITNDDHPHADIRNGEVFLNSIYQAITSSPNWSNTILVITFDEWGGFFDHVPPQIAPIPSGDAGLGSDGRRGFRVPTIVISPWSEGGSIAHGIYDHTSILNMIEWRWQLDPLTVRDQMANNLAEVLDFSHTKLKAPAINVPAGPFGGACPSIPSSDAESQALLAAAASFGFPIP